MQACYRVRSHVAEDGSLTVENTPFAAGQQVEVILLAEERQPNEENGYPLRGTVLQYVDPLKPVAEEEWEVLK